MTISHSQEKKTYLDLLIICTIIASLVIWYYWPSSNKEGQTPQSDIVQKLQVTRPLPQSINITTSLIGYITPIDSVEVIPYISGYIDDVRVKGGETVKSGERLFLIRQNEYQAKLNAAKANVLKAQAELNNSEIYYKRMRQAGTKIISPTELDNAKAAYLSAQATLAQAKAEQHLAQVNYDYTEINAPISGIIGDVTPRLGDYVSPSTGALVKIISFNPIWVVFSITDKEYLEQISLKNKGLFGGEEIKIRLSNGKIYPYSGKFSYLDNQLNKGTSSVAVYAEFPNPDRQLLTNAYVDVLLEKHYQNVILIPQNLVQLEEKAAYAYVVKNNILERRKIEILSVSANNYVIKNDFTPNDYLVTEPIGRAQTGGRVEMILPTSTPQPKEGDN